MGEVPGQGRWRWGGHSAEASGQPDSELRPPLVYVPNEVRDCVPMCLQEATGRPTELMCKHTVHQPLGAPPSLPEEPSQCPAEAWSRTRSLSADSRVLGSCRVGNNAGLALGGGTSQGCPLLLGTPSKQFPREPSSLAGGGEWA